MRFPLVKLIELSSQLISVSSKRSVNRFTRPPIPISVPINQTSVLDHRQIKDFRVELEKILNDNRKYLQIYEEIIEKFDQLNKPKVPDKQNLGRKLKFRLSYIISLIRKLTNTCNKAYLNDSSKLRLLTDTIIGKLDNVDSDDDTGIEIELLGFDAFDFEDFDVDSSLGEQLFGSEENYAKFLTEDYSNLSRSERNELFEHLLAGFTPELKLKYLAKIKSDYFLYQNGKQVSNPFVDYEENVIECLEKELKLKVDELKHDFEFIDKYISQLRVLVAKEWMHNYEDKYLQSMYGLTSDNPNVFYIDDTNNDNKKDDR